MIQLYGVAGSAVIALVGTIVILKVLDLTMGCASARKTKFRGSTSASMARKEYIFV
ncbi:MAG: hypothetical protein U0992_23300 [Planctomycetaceae bacterium]